MVGRVTHVEDVGYSKIRNFGHSVFGKQHVFWLEIAMHHVILMQKFLTKNKRNNTNTKRKSGGEYHVRQTETKYMLFLFKVYKSIPQRGTTPLASTRQQAAFSSLRREFGIIIRAEETTPPCKSRGSVPLGHCLTHTSCRLVAMFAQHQYMVALQPNHVRMSAAVSINGTARGKRQRTRKG